MFPLTTELIAARIDELHAEAERDRLTARPMLPTLRVAECRQAWSRGARKGSRGAPLART